MICFALKLAPWSLNKRKMRLHHWMKNNNITMCSCKITLVILANLAEEGPGIFEYTTKETCWKLQPLVTSQPALTPGISC